MPRLESVESFPTLEKDKDGPGYSLGNTVEYHLRLQGSELLVLTVPFSTSGQLPRL